MNDFLLYLLKSTLCMSALYLIFRIVMRKQTFFQLNRVILLSIVVFAIVIPLVYLPHTVQPAFSFQPAPAAEQINTYQPEKQKYATLTGKDLANQPSKSSSRDLAFSWPQLLLIIYLSGLSIALLASLTGFLPLIALFRKTPVIRKNGFRLLIARSHVPAFSIGRYMIISYDDYQTNGEVILTHEQAHIRFGHFYDLVFLEVVKIIYWFNPLIYLLIRDLKAVHEFQADEHALSNGINVTQYQLLIIQKGVGPQKFALANSFNHCQIKNRIAMINKQKTSKAWGWMAAAFLPVLVLLLMAFGRTDENVPPPNFAVADVKQQNQLDTLISGKRLFIKDTTKYSRSFINGLKSGKGYETIKLIDDCFYYTYRPNNKPDTLVTYKDIIPTNLKLNKETLYSTMSGSKLYTLILKRTNYTNIEYHLNQEGKTIKSGIATLQSTFYLGLNNYFDEKGEQIWLQQYLDLDKCGANIKVEIERADKSTISYCIDEKTDKWTSLPPFKRE